MITAICLLAGLAFFIGGAVALWRNGSRGARFDPVSGELEWWQHRTSRDPGLHGRIHPRDILRFIIVERDESDDAIFLVDRDELACAWFDAEVLPWGERVQWIEQVVAAYPHIVLKRL